MSTLSSSFLATLQERGFIHQATDLAALDALAAKECITAYVGYDLTADSLHIGHLVSIMMLRWMQKTGHRPITLLGGGTTRIGDPSGRDETRRMLDDEQIAVNRAGIEHTFRNFLDYDGAGRARSGAMDGQQSAMMANNAEWLDELAYIPFLRDIGRHFTINRMLTFDSVRLRLDREQPLTFLEFNYMILQAYDFMELSRRYGCRLQMGGSDQWGNIVNGVELTRRVTGQEVFGLTCPLIMTASGQKMGKSMGGAVWLNPARLSPYEYWQFWRNTEDADVVRFLKLFTELPMDEIARLEQLGGQEINEVKKVLATEATALCHGREAAELAAETARRTFEQGDMATGLPGTDIAADALAAGVPLLQALQMVGLAASNSEGRRLVRQGGARVNDERIDNEEHVVGRDDLRDGIIKLSAGKKRHAALRLV
ncbi:tyrosine--tRNA ligase [Fodinicurvata sp. EGI_FJ10296]|uniref:tyrosine--tRNA ligase n=1 Tax=Fodinicurvata sp. EGI_FJ10296 TaxID=3231908 RepID=UPI003456A7EB